VLLRYKIKVFLSNLKAAVSGHNVGILDILLVQGAEAPVGVLGAFCVLELGDLAENSNLLDQALQSTNVDGEGRVVRIGLDSSLLVLAQLLNPDGHHLLELGASQEAE
jgi:hypothetical protein